MTRQQLETCYLHITPSQRCFYCPRHTSIALVYDPGVREAFQPLCPLHGYASPSAFTPTEHDMCMQQEAVSRFVNWMHDGTAHITLVSPVQEVASIPGYEEYCDHDAFMQAWYVGYELADTSRQECYVIFNTAESPAGQFYLFSSGVEYANRAIHWIVSE